MKKRMWKWIYVAIVAIGLLAVLLLLLLPKNPLPPSIRQQLTSTLLLPTDSQAKVDRESAKYDEQNSLLSFTIAYADTQIVVSEQPTPESFIDIPEVFEKVTEQMQEYATFEVDMGVVHLTKPKELAGKQAAVLNAKGTLLFAKPEQDLSDAQWRKLFNSFVVSK